MTHLPSDRPFAVRIAVCVGIALIFGTFACPPARQARRAQDTTGTTAPLPPTLSIEVVGPGTTIPEPGMHSLNRGTTQSIRAVPDPTAYFVGWSGDVSGDTLGNAVVMEDDRTAVAMFRALGDDEVAVIRDIQPHNAGRIVLDPPGDTPGVYGRGTQVTIRAVANEGFEFVRFSGGLSGIQPEGTIFLERIVTVTAVFRGARGPCTGDPDCDDALFCNGGEICIGGACAPGTPPCTGAEQCDEPAQACASAPPQIPLPSISDLSIVPTSGEPGSPVQVTFTLANEGAVAFPESTVRVYLSASSLDPGNTQLISFVAPDLGPNEAESIQTTVTIPAGTLGGLRFVWATVDPVEGIATDASRLSLSHAYFVVVNEVGPASNENSNSEPPLPPQSDLVVDSFAVLPTSGLPGSNATVSLTVVNQGPALANPSMAVIRLNSSSASVSGSDPMLAVIDTPALPSGGVQSFSQPVTIPTDTTFGLKFLWVTLDADDTANQSDRNNDRSNAAFNVAAPVSFPPFPAPPPECQIDSNCDDGQFCNGTETCVSGVCAAGEFACPGMLCSEDFDFCFQQECDSSAECDDGEFCNGQEFCNGFFCEPGFAPCGFGTLCIEDDDACLTLPDLVPQNMVIDPASAEPGMSVDVSFTVANLGQIDSSQTQTEIQLFDGVTQVLATIPTAPIPAGGSIDLQQSVIIPGTSCPQQFGQISVLVDAPATAGQACAGCGSNCCDDLLVAPFVVDPIPRGPTGLVSLSLSGQAGNGSSGSGAISPNGQLVVFSSLAADLVASDTNEARDHFLRDLSAGTTIALPFGAPTGNIHPICAAPDYFERKSFSADGRYVAVSTDSFNVGIYDSASAASTIIPGFLAEPALSSSGRYLAYTHYCLVPDLIEVHDRDPDGNGVFDEPCSPCPTNSIVSVSSAGSVTNGPSRRPAISDDGRFVAFDSSGNNLAVNDTNFLRDVFVHDRDADANGMFDEACVGCRETTRVSVSSTGEQANAASSNPSMSADGRFVVFTSSASNLAPGTSGQHVYIRDRLMGTTSVVSGNTFNVDNCGVGAQISADGQFVAFTGTLLGGCGEFGVLVHDLQTGVATLESIGSTGTAAGGGCGFSISGDGRFVAFDTFSPLSTNDTNGTTDVYVHDRQPSP